MISNRAIYVFQLDAVLKLEGSTDAIVAKAVKAKLSSIWIKIAESDAAMPNTLGELGQKFVDLVTKCGIAGIDVYGWHVPFCETSEAADHEVALLANLVDQFHLAGVVIDNEDGANFFKGDATTAERYGRGLNTELKKRNKIMLMSSNDIISYHEKSYARVIGEFIDVNAPQVYYGGAKTVAARLNWAIRENKAVPAPLFPVGVCVVERDGEAEGAFSDVAACVAATRDFIHLVSTAHYVDPKGTIGYGFWDWDQAPSEFWQVLFDTDVFVSEAEVAAQVAPLAHLVVPAVAPAPAAAGLADDPQPPSGANYFVYEQSTGRMLIREDGTYDTIGVGYSGSLSGDGKNDPSKQCVRNVGPIPRGLYTIGGPIAGPSPYSLPLTPDRRNNMCGRGDFLIHGDSISHPGDASDGCIILSRSEREAIVKTGVNLLHVTDMKSA